MYQNIEIETTVCVVGLGYVGFPLARAFSRVVKTIGYDIDTEKIEAIQKDPENAIIATSDPAKIRESDVVIIAVPTPVTCSKDPDLTYVGGAAKVVGENLKRGVLSFWSLPYIPD